MKYLILALSLLSLSFTALAKYEEGEHYTVLDLPKSRMPELREFFSFYCPACNNIERILPAVEDRLRDNITLEKTHADIMRNSSSEVQYWFAVGYEAAKQIGWAKPFVDSAFSLIHDQRGVFVGEKSVREIFQQLGLESSKIDTLLNSFAVRSRANKHKKMVQTLRDAGALKSVPTFVAHGKYLINIQSLDQAKVIDEIADITNFLAFKE